MKIMSPHLDAIVAILSDGHYHDGTTIGKALNLTRTAVWKIIKKLQHYGIQIVSQKGKGYILQQPLILLNKERIQQNSGCETWDISVFETITSTNDYLKSFRHLKQSKLCLAEHMSQGRGRLHRKWQAPFGKNIYLSCLYPFQKDVSELAGLSLVMGLAIVKTLNHFGILQSLLVKWPNDILYDDKKMSGVLIDIQAETHGHCQAIVGIGLNVNGETVSETIEQPVTSMQQILQQSLDRNKVCAVLIQHMLQALQQFDHAGFAPFVNEWRQVDSLLQQTITLTNMDKVVSGNVVGVNDHGHLLLQLDNGNVQAYSAGDVSGVRRRDILIDSAL